MFGGSWCIIQTKSGKWFIMNFMSDRMYNMFGEHKKKYRYVSEPLPLEQAREALKELVSKTG